MFSSLLWAPGSMIFPLTLIAIGALTWSESLENDIVQFVGIVLILAVVLVNVLQEISKHLVGTRRRTVPEEVAERAWARDYLRLRTGGPLSRRCHGNCRLMSYKTLNL